MLLFFWAAAMTRLQELSETFANNPLAELLNPPPLDDTFGALFLGMVLGLMCVHILASHLFTPSPANVTSQGSTA